MVMKRKIAAMKVPGVEPAPTVSDTPTFEWIDPALLLVDETYQRNLSERSIKLIRKIVGNWDWSRFKPPVCARNGDDIEVIDGQHTAIAAATHPAIDKIPVMIVGAHDQAARASAFVGHNRDRIALTATQMHAAAVAAGDEDAVTVAQVCGRAGVVMLKNPPGNGAFKPGETLAVASIRSLISRRGAMLAREVLQVLTEARCAPISAAGIKAVEMLLHDQEYAGQVQAADLSSTILELGPAADQEAKVFAAAHSVPLWKALGIVLYRRSRRGRRRAA